MATELNGWYMQGWTWASVTDVGELLSEFTLHAGGFVYDEVDSSWAPAFLELFRPTFSATYANFVAGITREKPNILLPRISIYFQRSCTDTLTFYKWWGCGPRVGDQRCRLPFTTSNHSTGAWMYRDVSPVPLPSSMALRLSPSGIGGSRKAKTA